MNFTGFPGFPTNYRQDPPPRVEELPETGSETRRWLEQAEWSGPGLQRSHSTFCVNTLTIHSTA